MFDLGLIKFFLGLEIHQSTEGILISQKRYTKDLLINLNMKQCKHIETSMGVIEKFMNENRELTDPTVYKSLVGKLLYVVHTGLTFVMPLISYLDS